jgi:hypothetical protein
MDRNILTSNKAERDLASRTIFLHVASLRSRVGALPRMKRDDLARVSATFMRRMSVRLSDQPRIYSFAYLIRNQLIAGQVLREHMRE